MRTAHPTRRRTAKCAVSPAPDGALHEVVEALCAGGGDVAEAAMPGRGALPWPSRAILIGLVEDLRCALFPGYFGAFEPTGQSVRFHVGSTLARVMHALPEQIERSLCLVDGVGARGEKRCSERAAAISSAFLSRLPEVRQLLWLDVAAAYEGDPAATCPQEVAFCYPGILAITSYRLAHELYALRVPLVPRIITEHAHSLTGIDIHPGASIGQRFFIDHGTGVVIGETSVIGNGVRIYQGVTLGARSFPLDKDGNPVKGIARHPIVEDDVIIYAGATILGRITIGRGSTIGGNVWLTRSVPPGTKVSPASARGEKA